MSRHWTHWATSKDLIDLRVPAHDAGTGLVGRPLGHLQRGSSFTYDPFDAYGDGLLSNPNMVVAGSIGTGKSTLVKMMLDRGLELGRRAVVVDPKGEYEALARSRGVSVIALGRDGWCSPFPSNDRDTRDLLRALLASAQGSPLRSDQHFALDEVCDELSTPRSVRVLRSIYERLRPHLDSVTVSPQRDLALVLYRFIHGDLAGLFDGDDEPMVFEGSLVVLDLSAQWSASSFPVAALSAVAAAQSVVATDQGPGYLVLDEAWSVIGDPAALRWLRGSWKLARAKGISHILVLHRWGDVAASGDLGSAHRERAQGLLRECDTAWLFRQPADEAHDMGIALGLHPREERYLRALPRGAALVRYGAHRSIVRLRPDASDVHFIDTDAAMRTQR